VGFQVQSRWKISYSDSSDDAVKKNGYNAKFDDDDHTSNTMTNFILRLLKYSHHSGVKTDDVVWLG
jgi:hypothetical protein